MDVMYCAKIVFFPIIYLAKGIKFTFTWFHDKWHENSRYKNDNFEDRVVIGILFTLFLIVPSPIVFSPLFLFGSVIANVFWLVLSVVGAVIALASGWTWIVF